MRFAEIISEARMGARELSSAPLPDNFTIGFEFEVVAEKNDFEVTDETLTDYGYDLDEIRSRIESDLEFDYSEIMEDVGILQIIKDLDLTPTYGYKTNIDNGITFDSEIWVDDEEDDYVSLDEIRYEYLEDFFDNFDESEFDELYVLDKKAEMTEDLYQEELKEIKAGFSPEVELINYVSNNLDNMGYSNTPSDDYHGMDKSSTEWYVEPDSSLEPLGAEIVTEVFDNYREAMTALEDVLYFIDNKKSLFTNDSCGLHINIGTFDRQQNIDWAKFLVFLGDKYILESFSRLDNQYASSYFTALQGIEEVADYKTYNELIEKMNRIILSNNSKYKSVNFEKLINGLGYIELRQLGGKNYETRFSEISNYINRALRALQIASDPTAYRNEYLKKLQKLKNFQYQNPASLYHDPQMKRVIDDAIKLVTTIYSRLIIDPKSMQTKEDFVKLMVMALNRFTERNDLKYAGENQILQKDPKMRTEIRNILNQLPGNLSKKQITDMLRGNMIPDFSSKFLISLGK